jgi:hypothetical protein
MRILDILLKSDDPRSPHFSSGFFLSIFLGVAFTVIVAILVEMLGKGTMQKLGALSAYFCVSNGFWIGSKSA